MDVSRFVRFNTGQWRSTPVGMAFETSLYLLFIPLILVRGGALVSELGSKPGLQSRGVAVLDHRWKEGPQRSMYNLVHCYDRR